MTLIVERGTFTKTTSTGVPVSQQVTLSNGSLTPKLLVLWTNGQTSINGTYADDARLSYGFSDGTNDACQAYRVDESAESEAYTFRDDSVIAIINLTTNAIVSQADVSAFAAGSFTLNWSVQSNTEALYIHYMVAGGTDITNVSCISSATGADVLGPISYTGSGTTFTPDFALTMTGSRGFFDINTLGSSADQSLFSIGAAKSTSKQWVMWGRDETVGTSDCDMYLDPNACVAACSTSTGAIEFIADFVSFDNAAGGGITVNKTNSANALDRIAFLLVKGGNWDCGTFQQRSGTGTQDVTLTTGLDPSLVFLGGINSATSATVIANNYIGIGASDGTNEGCSYSGNTNGAATFAAVHTGNNTKVYRMATPNATATSSTTNAECDMNDMATPGKFQLSWTTADTTLRQMAFWALGPVAAAGNAVERALTTETVSLSDSHARLAAKIRTRTDTAITIGETRARLSAKMRSIATQTTTLSENVIRVKGKVKSLATETITVAGGTLARLLAKIRTGSDTTAIIENRTRVAGKNKALTTETITIGAGISVRIKGIPRTISQTIIIGENLARLSTKIRALATQTITLGAGTAARLKASLRPLAAQTVAIGESLVRMKGAIRTIALQTVSTGENIIRLSAKIRALSAQTVALTEDLQRTLTAGAQNIIKSIIQTITLGESTARLKSSQRLISQTITLGENIARFCTLTRTLPQTVIIADARARLKGSIRALALQTVAASDSLARIKGGLKTIPQTITVGAGSIARLSAKIRAIPQTIIVAENAARLSTKLRALAAQTIVITDNRARVKGAVKTISQTILLTENRARLAAKTRVIAAQTVALADSVARQIIGGPVEIIRALTQTVVLSDSLSRRLAVQRILSQTVPMAENLARVRGVLRTLSQSIPISESRSRIKSASKLISQTILSSDNLGRMNALRRTVIQTTVLAENLAAETIGNLARSLVETITASDSIVRRTAKLVILDQFVIIAEQASRLSAKLRSIPPQTITLSDSVTNELNVIIKHVLKTIAQATTITDYAKIEVVKKSQRFRKILDPSIKRLISNHPAWLLGTRGQHDHYEEFSP